MKPATLVEAFPRYAKVDFGGGRVDTVSLDDVAPKGLQQSVENSREDSGPVDRPNEDSGPLDSPNEDSGSSSSSPNSNAPGSSPAKDSQSRRRDKDSQSKRRNKNRQRRGRDSPSRNVPETPEVPDESESEVEVIPEPSGSPRRRPGRSRKPPAWFGNYVQWDEMSD